MTLDELFRRLGINPADYKDLHVTRMLHAFVAISNRDVVKVTEPQLEYCPLVQFLYGGKGGSREREEVRLMIESMTREKMAKFGHFSAWRELERGDLAVPFGASEMMMVAMRKGGIDCAVTVCDGAGTVVAARAEVVQGVGARMNGLFYTTPIRETMARLEALGAVVPFPDTAAINQVEGLRRAAALGHRRIAVTVNGVLGDSLAEVRAAERELGVSVTLIIVCTTGAERSRVEEMRDHADMVWSCASKSVREIVGAASVIQVTAAIPVFAVTPAGVRFLAAYQADDSPNPGIFDTLDLTKQHLIAGNSGGRPIRMGRMDTFIAEAKLPVRSRNEPRPLTD